LTLVFSSSVLARHYLVPDSSLRSKVLDAIAVITAIKTAIFWDIMCGSVIRKKLFITSSPYSYNQPHISHL
jgi:hypothetical protein